MVGLQTLDLAIGVRVPASQPNKFKQLRAAQNRAARCVLYVRPLLSRPFYLAVAYCLSSQFWMPPLRKTAFLNPRAVRS